MKTVLIIGAGINQVPLIKLAKKRNYRVIVTDLNPNAVGFEYADYSYNISTTDILGTVKLAKELNKKIGIDGVTSMAAEVSRTIAAVAEELDLPGISPETAEVTTNKLKRYEILKKKGINIPLFHSATNKKEVISAIKNINLPAVIKPIDSAGARGVQKILSFDMIDSAMAEIDKYSKNSLYLIEEFLEGTEHSSESIVVDNVIYTTGFSDRNYDKKEINPPYFLEDGDTLPTELPDSIHKKTIELVEKAIRALGIDFGPAKGDILINEETPKILEMASRLSGDYFCWETVPLHNGTDILSVLLDITVGNKPNLDMLKPKFNRGVALRYLFPQKAGKVKSIKGVDEVKQMDGVHFFKWEPAYENISVGTDINIPTCHAERLGCVMTYADTRDDAVRIAEKAIKTIKIHVI
jgi:biotin carboxylase